MNKETATKSSTDTETTPTSDTELSEQQLDGVAGGCRKAGGEQTPYLTFTFDTATVTSV